MLKNGRKWLFVPKMYFSSHTNQTLSPWPSLLIYSTKITHKSIYSLIILVNVQYFKIKVRSHYEIRYLHVWASARILVSLLTYRHHTEIPPTCAYKWFIKPMHHQRVKPFISISLIFMHTVDTLINKIIYYL